MTFTVIRDSVAQADMAAFGNYASDYNEDFVREQFARLNLIFSVDLAESPNA